MADWQSQNFKKSSGASGPSQMNSKICAPVTSGLHGKIAKPTGSPSTASRPVSARPIRKYADGSPGGVQDDATGVDEAIARNAAADASTSGEWARGENYGDGSTGDERVASARAPSMSSDEASAKTSAMADAGDAEWAAQEKASLAEAKASAPKQSFKEAFASNRSAGAKTFEWNGKKFTTEVAGSKTAARPVSVKKSAPSEGSEDTLSQGLGRDYAKLKAQSDAAQSMEGANNQSKRMVKKLADDALKAYEDAAYAEKTGRSVVLKR